MRDLLRPLIEALFRVLFTYDCLGEEHVPGEGPAVVAANHPSYLDPVLLSLQLARPIRFMAWDALFRVPLLGQLIRAFGAFPVDVRRGKGRSAYDAARAMVEAGEVVGIFPEGRRSQTGWMEESLYLGAVRLARDTGAPLVPATISGAFRAWPHYQSLPRPARIRVRYHEPIDPGAYQALPEDEALQAMLAELRRRVERSLLPAVKRDLRVNVLFRSPAPWPRLYESAPPLALALLVFWRTREMAAMWPGYAYVAYLLADHFVIPQGRLIKWLRNASPVLFLLAWSPWILNTLGLPETPAPRALLALTAGAMFPYLYSRARTALDFVRGMVLALLLELGALALVPTPLGPHVALPLYAAAFAWQRRSVFWPWAVATLLAWVGFVLLELGAGLEVLPHATTGLLAWLLGSLLPGGPPAAAASDAAEAPAHLLSLDLDRPEEEPEEPDQRLSGSSRRRWR